MTNILLGIIALELLAIFSKLDKLEERGRDCLLYTSMENLEARR